MTVVITNGAQKRSEEVSALNSHIDIVRGGERDPNNYNE